MGELFHRFRSGELKVVYLLTKSMLAVKSSQNLVILETMMVRVDIKTPISEALCIGKFDTFRSSAINDKISNEVSSNKNKRSAFEILMRSANERTGFPNQLDQLKNKIIDLLKKIMLLLLLVLWIR